MIHKRWNRWSWMVLAVAAGMTLAGCEKGTDQGVKVKEGQFDKPLAEYYRIKNGTPILVEGYTIVVGLRDTGGIGRPPDLSEDAKQDINKRLADYRMTGEDLDKRSTAVVRVSATLPPFSQNGTVFDVLVQTTGDGTESLQGGIIKHGWMKYYVDAAGKDSKLERKYGFDKFSVIGGLTLQPPGIPNFTFAPDPRVAFIPAGGCIQGVSFPPSLEILATADVDKMAQEVAENKFHMTIEEGKIAGMTDPEAFRYVLKLPEDKYKRLALVTTRAITSRFGRNTAMKGDDKFGRTIPLALPDDMGYRYDYRRFFSVLGQVKPSDLVDGGESDVKGAIEKLRSGSPEEQGTASLRLEAIGPKAVPALAKLAREGMTDSALSAALILARMGKSEALGFMSRFAAGGTIEQRIYVARTAIFLGRPAVTMLQQMLRDDNGLARYYAFFGLDVLGERLAGHRTAPMLHPGGYTDFYLDQFDQPGKTMIVVKTEIPRRIVFFGSDPAIKRNVKIVQGPFTVSTDEVGRVSLTLDIGERFHNETKSLGNIGALGLVSQLHAFGVSFNDISAILKRLVDEGNVPVAPADLVWIQQQV